MNTDNQEPFFGNLFGNPLLYSCQSAFVFQSRSEGWTPIEPNKAVRAIPLGEKSFFMLFGFDLPPLPEPFSKLDHRLWLVIEDGIRVAESQWRPASYQAVVTSDQSIDLANVVAFPSSAQW